MAQVAQAIVDVSEVSSPEQFTFVLQLAVRPIIQLKIPPHLSAPTELKFEKERLTPEEITEENCCNLILPRLQTAFYWFLPCRDLLPVTLLFAYVFPGFLVPRCALLFGEYL